MSIAYPPLKPLRIIYVANHDQVNSNDDEGSITHALSALGHDVQRLRESKGHTIRGIKGDLILFHKWFCPSMQYFMKDQTPQVFWYFDLVDYPDPTLERRNNTRKAWMREIVPAVDLGFCTDGDWVAKDTTGKLVHLTQGADQRLVGHGIYDKSIRTDILFTGIGVNGGKGRMGFINELEEVYENQFTHISSGLHREALRDAIAANKILICPDHPVTSRYWSNRVYNALGFGACVIHPYCEGLTHHYENGKDLMLYRNRTEMHQQIEYLLNNDDARGLLSYGGLKRTMKEHTYLHRCRELIRITRERLSI